MTNFEALNAGGPTAWAELLYGHTEETYSKEYQQENWWLGFDDEGHMDLLVKELSPFIELAVSLDPYTGDYEYEVNGYEPKNKTGIDIVWESIRNIQEKLAFITWLGYEFNPEKSQWLKELIAK